MNELIILSAFAIGFLFGNIWDFIVKRLSKWDNKQHQEPYRLRSVLQRLFQGVF